MPAVIKDPLEIAIVGGGIVGLALATGLVHRNINVKLYEKTSAFRPIGAGIGFTPNTKQALQLLHPGAFEAEQKVATCNGDPKEPNDWLRYLDAYHRSGDPMHEPLLYELYSGYRGFEGCVRADFLNELLKLIPEDVVQFGKSIRSIDDRGDDEKVVLHFDDGSTAEADAVIGCDGIKSRVRKLLLGAESPCAEPSYNHQYALRGVVPMPAAIEALGDYKARNRHMHLGPGQHVVTVPIALGKAINVVAFIQDPNEWPSTDQLTAPGDPAAAQEAFKDFGKPVRNLIKTLVETSPSLTKWGIFDSVDNPAPTFTKGRICIAGDAAHASSPHHGAGAGMGVEDDLVLSELLADVVRVEDSVGRSKAVRAAFNAYTETRKERTQWVAESSRVIGQIFEWRYPSTMRDWNECLRELTERSHRIWHFDQEEMLKSARMEFERSLADA